MIADVALLRVVGGNQQRPTGVAEAEAFALNAVLAAANRGQHQIDDAVVQQVQLIDIEHAAVGVRQKPGLEHGAAAGQRGGHIHGAHQAVLGDAEGDLHEGGWNYRRGRIAGDPVTGGVVPLLRVLRVEVAAHAALDIQNVDRREQGVQAPCQHRLAGATATCDHHATQAGIHRGQQQSQLQRAVASDRRQRKGPGGLVVLHRYTGCHHGRIQPVRARQSR